MAECDPRKAPARPEVKRYPYHCPLPHCPKYDDVCQRNLCKEILETRDQEQTKVFMEEFHQHLDFHPEERKALDEELHRRWPDATAANWASEVVDVPFSTSVDATKSALECCKSCRVEQMRRGLVTLRNRNAVEREEMKQLKEYITLREEGEERAENFTEPKGLDETPEPRAPPTLAPTGSRRKKGPNALKPQQQLNAAGANKQGKH